MDLDQATDFARQRSQGVLTTIRANGRPQLSNILYLMETDGTAVISITDDRAKTKNLRRDPRASLYVVGDSFWAYVVLEGSVTLSAVAQRPDDAVVEALVAMYRAAQGEHPDWDEFREHMVTQKRIAATFTPERAYGMTGA